VWNHCIVYIICWRGYYSTKKILILV